MSEPDAQPTRSVGWRPAWLRRRHDDELAAWRQSVALAAIEAAGAAGRDQDRLADDITGPELINQPGATPPELVRGGSTASGPRRTEPKAQSPVTSRYDTPRWQRDQIRRASRSIPLAPPDGLRYVSNLYFSRFEVAYRQSEAEDAESLNAYRAIVRNLTRVVEEFDAGLNATARDTLNSTISTLSDIIYRSSNDKFKRSTASVYGKLIERIIIAPSPGRERRQELPEVQAPLPAESLEGRVL